MENDKLKGMDKIYSFCAVCGINVYVDEDGGCSTCGGDSMGLGVDSLNEILLIQGELVEVLGNLVILAKRESWDKASTGRQLLIADAESALGKAAQLCANMTGLYD